VGKGRGERGERNSALMNRAIIGKLFPARTASHRDLNKRLSWRSREFLPFGSIHRSNENANARDGRGARFLAISGSPAFGSCGEEGRRR